MPEDERPRVTIADIAREAGVSVPTVSKVLNGKHEVAAATRDRIEALIEKHRYARRPRRPLTRAGLVDLVFPTLDSAWDVEIIRGVEEIAHQAKIGTVVSAIHGPNATARNWLDNLSNRRSDGVILAVSDLTPGQTDRVRSLGMPIVAIDPTGGTAADIPSVGATNWQGALTATEHLILLGHRDIAFLGGPERLQCSQAREDGYRSAMRVAGLPIRPELLRAGDFSHEAGQKLMAELLELPVPPTAVFAGNDQQALGACQAIREHGLRIPDHVNVIGFDDLPAARWTNPPLTTIRQPIAEMAAQAMRMLLRYLDTGHYGTQRVELSTELVIRSSTAARDRFPG